MTTKGIIFWTTICLSGVLGTCNLFPDSRPTSDEYVDSMIVYKSKRQLLIFAKGHLIKTYKISLGKNPTGDKEFQGDKKTPEGVYFINDKNPNSHYHKSLGISYPNKSDIEKAKKQGKTPGGDIKIHGLRNGFGFIRKLQRVFDWTAGCIALTDQEIDELYKMVKIGTKIEIKP